MYDSGTLTFWHVLRYVPRACHLLKKPFAACGNPGFTRNNPCCARGKHRPGLKRPAVPSASCRSSCRCGSDDMPTCTASQVKSWRKRQRWRAIMPKISAEFISNDRQRRRPRCALRPSCFCGPKQPGCPPVASSGNVESGSSYFRPCGASHRGIGAAAQRPPAPLAKTRDQFVLPMEKTLEQSGLRYV